MFWKVFQILRTIKLNNAPHNLMKIFPPIIGHFTHYGIWSTIDGIVWGILLLFTAQSIWDWDLIDSRRLDPFRPWRKMVKLKKGITYMTSYAPFPGHETIRDIMEAHETDTSSISPRSSNSISSTSGSTSGTSGSENLDQTDRTIWRNISSSSADNIPVAPPCSLSGSSENLTPNLDSTGMG